MNYELRLFDTSLLVFSANPQSSDPGIELQWASEPNKHLLPLGIDLSSRGIARWLTERTIPKNRAYMQQFLASCGLTANRVMATVVASRALSLNDSYWVVEQGSSLTFGEVNLYENPISRLLAHIVFTGYGSNVGSTFVSSPEFTTNGALPKCWRRERGTAISLWKGGTEGAANAGNEPYSEFYAYQVARAMGLDAVEYRLSRWKGRLCSVCPLFTSKEIAFVPVHRLVREGGLAAVEQLYDGYGPAFARAFAEMLAFDAVTCNTDRHFGNFGILVESRTNRILGPAPLFDHGNALFPQAFGNDLASPALFDAYAQTFRPRAYDDFFDEARSHLAPQLRTGLRGLLDFRFAKSRCSNLPNARLHLLEDQVHKRAAKILA